MTHVETLGMADLAYAVVLEPEDGSIRVIVPAFPEISTFGVDVADALAMARDAISLSVAYRTERGLDIPPGDAGSARLETIVVTAPAA